jgi:hypothetical protein
MFSRLESGRNPARKLDFRPGSTIAQHRVLNIRLAVPAAAKCDGLAVRRLVGGRPEVVDDHSSNKSMNYFRLRNRASGRRSSIYGV